MIKNKKGFLLGEETVKIIIAVLAIGILVYFLFSLYYNSQKNDDLDQAEASLNYLITEIDAGSTRVEIYKPQEWWLASWPINGVSSPSCTSNNWENCICICGEADDGELVSWGVAGLSDALLSKIANDCSGDFGLCTRNEGGFAVEPAIIDNSPEFFEINHEEKTIEEIK